MNNTFAFPDLPLTTTVWPAPKAILPERPLRIGFFTDTYAPQINGIAISLQLLTRGLRAAGHDVSVFAPRFPAYSDAEPGVHRIPALRYMQRPPVYVAVPGTLQTTLSLQHCQFDVLHVHSPLTVGLLAYLTARAKDLPLIYTYHTSITDYTHYLKGVGQARPIRWAARYFSTTSANLADQIVVPSAKFKRLLQDQNVRRPLNLIPNGIDLSQFQQAKCAGIYRERLGLSAEAPLLLYVGRLDPEKQIDFLIEAFAKIAAIQPNAHLVIAGDGSSRPKLESQASNSGFCQRIHFLGMVSRSDLPNLLADATLFLTASTSETQCIAMVEAIAAGLPVVAVRDEAFEGMLAEGVNGRAVQREAGPFCAAVCGLLADPAALQRYGQKSKEFSQKFSIEAQVAALVELYRTARPDHRSTRYNLLNRYLS